MGKNKNFIIQKNRILYAFIDYIIVFLFTFLSHCTIFFNNNSIFRIGIIIYCLGISLLSVVFFILFRIYLILTTQISISDGTKIFIVSSSVQLFGFVIEIILNYSTKIYIAPEWYVSLFSNISISFLLIALRVGLKAFYSMLVKPKKKNLIPTLIIGAGSVGKIIYESISGDKNSKNIVVGFVDDDSRKIGSLLFGLPIYGPIKNIKNVVTLKKVETVIIAISNLSKNNLKEIIDKLNECSVRIKRAPLLSEMNGPYDIKTTDVNIDEILGRKKIKLDNSKISNLLSGKTVLITGAGGTIGSELSKQIFFSKPKTLILFDIYENGVYDIQTTLMQIKRKEYIDNVEIITLIGSTYNLERMEDVISTYLPDFIYHAAAYKHVPLMEDSPQEALRTNVIGTYNVAKLADKYKVKQMILVSTDKAVRPTNIMGASKKLAEEIIKYFSKNSINTLYSAVRFGNVLQSNGSVIPLFKKQINGMGPVTITDKRITRYFMAIDEAVALILQCSLFSKGGDIFILDMGKPIKIFDVANIMIRQAGYKPNKDIKIIEIGLRPGEKLYEELLVDKSRHKKVAYDLIFVEEYTKSIFTIELISKLQKIIKKTNARLIKEDISKILKSYTIL